MKQPFNLNSIICAHPFHRGCRIGYRRYLENPIVSVSILRGELSRGGKRTKTRDTALRERLT